MKPLSFKEDVEARDLEMVHPALWILLLRTILYCAEFQIPCRVTSLISDRKNVKSTSRTHEEGRAFDISIDSWSEFHVHRFLFLMNSDYRDIAAISASDGNPRAAVYHNYQNQGKHIHLQVRRDAPVFKFCPY